MGLRDKIAGFLSLDDVLEPVRQPAPATPSACPSTCSRVPLFQIGDYRITTSTCW